MEPMVQLGLKVHQTTVVTPNLHLVDLRMKLLLNVQLDIAENNIADLLITQPLFLAATTLQILQTLLIEELAKQRDALVRLFNGESWLCYNRGSTTLLRTSSRGR